MNLIGSKDLVVTIRGIVQLSLTDSDQYFSFSLLLKCHIILKLFFLIKKKNSFDIIIVTPLCFIGG